MFATSSWPTRRALLTGQSSGRNKRIESLSFHQTYRYGSSSLGTNYKDDIGNAVVETSPEPSPSSSTNEYESRILSYFRGVHANLVSSLSGPSAAAHHPSESGRAVRTSRSLIEAEEDIPRTKLSRNVKVKGSFVPENHLDPTETTRKVRKRGRPAGDVSAGNDAEKLSKMKKATTRSVTRNVSDTNIPTSEKRPASAYMLFVAENRDRLRKEVDEANEESRRLASTGALAVGQKLNGSGSGTVTWREYASQGWRMLDADTRQMYIDKVKSLLAKWSERRTAQLRNVSVEELEAVNLARKKHGLSNINMPRPPKPKRPLTGYQRFYADYRTRSPTDPTIPKQPTQKSKSTSQPDQPEDQYAFRRSCASLWLSMRPEEREPWNGPARLDLRLWKERNLVQG